MDIRNIALQSLIEICKDNGYSNIVVSQAIKRYHFPDRDRRFYTELVYGTVRQLNYLDWIIASLSKRKLKQLDPICLAILRMGLYQLFCLDKVPDSAACNESVKLARSRGNEGMAKFVNAILRNSIRQRNTLVIPSLEENPVLHISLHYHQPDWLVKIWLAEYGTDDTIKLCQYFEAIPELCVRTNTSKITRADLIKRFSAEGIEATPAKYAPEGIYLPNAPAISSIKPLAEGLCSIQDEPSMLVAHVLNPKEHDIIFDVCAAPGGKSTHLAALAGPKSTVYSFDIYEHKLKLIENGAHALDLKNIRVLLQNGCTIGDTHKEQADCVLVDAPCSGLGVLKRKLDLRWRKNVSDLKTLPKLQGQILASAAKCVKPGGTLVYSTCTMNNAENEEVVATFLKKNPEFHLENASDYCDLKKDGPYIKLLPQVDGLDGFFIARMVKGAGNE